MAGKLVRGVVYLVLAFYILCTVCLVSLRWANPLLTSVQLQRRVESLLADRAYEARKTFVPLRRIPSHIQHAVIAAEDGSFYSHSGIDWQELGKVFEEAQTGGRLRGGSTITQQLVKNLFLTTHRWPVRKAAEFTLAPVAEAVLSKRRILEIYLNIIEWGPGVYGVEEAAGYHYGVAAASLDREQAARLAACIPAPRTRRPERMNEYSAVILERMNRRGW